MHCVRHNPVRVAFLDRPQATPAFSGGGEFHLRGILDRQYMPSGDGRSDLLAPALDDLRRRHAAVGEEPTGLQLTTTVTTQPAQADRLARDHPFEDRTPPLSRRTSPNDPSDHSILGSCSPVAGINRIVLAPSRANDFFDRYDCEHYMCA
jgi:hypothetical protein